jgi:hypothetical protein
MIISPIIEDNQRGVFKIQFNIFEIKMGQRGFAASEPQQMQ